VAGGFGQVRLGEPHSDVAASGKVAGAEVLEAEVAGIFVEVAGFALTRGQGMKGVGLCGFAEFVGQECCLCTGAYWMREKIVQNYAYYSSVNVIS
jgi:hypothetical protein